MVGQELLEGGPDLGALVAGQSDPVLVDDGLKRKRNLVILKIRSFSLYRDMGNC